MPACSLCLRSSSCAWKNENWFSVELKDTDSGTNVKIIKLPRNSIVIKADAFELKKVIFNGNPF